MIRVRIDHQQRMPVRRVLGRNGEAVRSRGLTRLELRVEFLPRRRGGRHTHARRVELLNAAGVHTGDVATDAAFGERERHPRLELREQLRLHLRVRGQIVIQPIGEAVHQRLQPHRALGVLRLHVERVDEQLHAQVAPERALAFHFRRAAHRGDVVRLHAIEVVLGLRIHHAKHGIGIRFAIDVGNAVLVAHDRDAVGLFLPFRRLRRRDGGHDERREQQGRRDGGAEHDAHGRAYSGLQVGVTGGTPRWRCRRRSACAAASRSWGARARAHARWRGSSRISAGASSR